MRPLHLSDEAVAAFADGVLSSHARERAARHTAECPECAYAVAVQREAVWALRAAPAPALPTNLLDRLRDVPTSAPLNLPQTVIGPDGIELIATFRPRPTRGEVLLVAAMAPAAPTPPVASGEPAASTRSTHASHRLRPIVVTAVAVAAAGVVAVGSAAPASGASGPASTRPVTAGGYTHVQPAMYAPAQSHR